MEDLFTTTIASNNQNIKYRVVFDNEKYTFISELPAGLAKEFAFTREEDEWKDVGDINPEIRSQAIDALETYLMKQH
jgi:hypothetical protein